MPEQTTSTIEIDASPDQVMAVIVDFEDYPSWVQGMKRVEIVQRASDGRAEQVHFDLDAGVKDSYTLAYDYAGEHTLRWHLVDGKLDCVVAVGQDALVEQPGHGRRPGAVEAAPGVGAVERRAEVVQQRHGRLLWAGLGCHSTRKTW